MKGDRLLLGIIGGLLIALLLPIAVARAAPSYPSRPRFTGGSGGTVDLSDYVTLSTTQTISGAKTFSSAITSSTTSGYAFSMNEDTRIGTGSRYLQWVSATGNMTLTGSGLNVGGLVINSSGDITMPNSSADLAFVTGGAIYLNGVGVNGGFYGTGTNIGFTGNLVGNTLLGTNNNSDVVSCNSGITCFVEANRFKINGGTGAFVYSTAPTISSGFCTSPTITQANGTASFKLTIGTGCAAGTGVITLPAASNGWTCTMKNLTAPDTNEPDQTAESSTSVSFKNYTRAGVAANWTAGDVHKVSCSAN